MKKKEENNNSISRFERNYLFIRGIFVEFSVPLISGVIVALLWANYSENQAVNAYKNFIHFDFLGGGKFLKHTVDFHFLVNDVFMVFFFGIAAVEITKSFYPGGGLSSISKALNPIFSTIGGIAGPVLVFFILINVFETNSMGNDDTSLIAKGWAIPTATDIAIAWLVASLIFGRKHPAISFILFLAIIDDAIGLIIVAIFYPTPGFPVEPIYLLINVFAMLVAFGMRKKGVNNFWWYLLFAGVPSWFGLLLSHLHASLALVCIIPFLPYKASPQLDDGEHSALMGFEHTFEMFVNLGLFLFAIANAGVAFSLINNLTLVIFLSLFIGKVLGITGFSMAAHSLGFHRPDEVNVKSVLVLSMVAGIGLTVALFVAEVAYSDPILNGASKMGALFSCFMAVFAILTARIFRIKKML